MGRAFPVLWRKPDKRIRLGDTTCGRVTAMPARRTSFHQSTFFWGCGGAFLAIVVTVIATMLKDVRWLLIVAWPFGAFAVWEFARTWAWRKENLITIVTTSGTIIIGIGLAALYIWLSPEILASTVAKADRHLKEYQKVQLSECIDNNVDKLTGMFLGSAYDSESMQFSTEIMQLIDDRTSLKLVNPTKEPLEERWNLTSYKGVYVSITDIKKPPSGAAVLLNCLRKAGINADYSQIAEGSAFPGQFGLSVAPQ